MIYLGKDMKGVEVGVVTTFMLRLFVPHEFDMMSHKETRGSVLVNRRNLVGQNTLRKT